MGAVRVQTKSATADAQSGNPATVSVTFTTTPIVGNFITVEAGMGGSGAEVITTCTFSDNKANVYTTDVVLCDHLSIAKQVAIGSAPITISSATFTVTVGWVNTGVHSDYLWITVQEWSGIALAGSLDKTASTDHHATTSSPADTGASATLTQANEIVVAAVMHGGTATYTKEAAGTVPSSGWTEEYNSSGSVTENGAAATVIVTVTTGARMEWTLGTVQKWMAVLATYKVTGQVSGATFARQAVKRAGSF